MIRSMTGFGEAGEQVAGVHYHVELRSLNNRFFKSTIRLPEEIAGLEAELETQLRRRLSRGSVTLIVKMEGLEAHAHRVNDAALLTYLEHLERLQARISSSGGGINIDLTALLNLPGVLRPMEELDTWLERARPVVQRLVDRACDKLLEMREVEGRAVAEDLAVLRGKIRERLDVIAGRAPLVAEEYHQRLRARIDELAARAQLQLDERDLIREVAVFAERADVAEEIKRMVGHLDQFDHIIRASDGEPAGRTLDFLAQELLREANTIASKSNDGLISRAVVEVKGAIDRIKEQVQNVE